MGATTWHKTQHKICAAYAQHVLAQDLARPMQLTQLFCRVAILHHICASSSTCLLYAILFFSCNSQCNADDVQIAGLLCARAARFLFFVLCASLEHKSPFSS